MNRPGDTIREGELEELTENAFALLSAKYVQRGDERQRDMGLQYTTAETHELAKTVALFALRTRTASSTREGL